MNTLRLLTLLALAALAGVTHVRAGGPLTAVSTTARKYAAGSFPLTYRVDQGTLGAFSNATATSIVVYAFWEWDSIQSAALSFNSGTQLARDVTSSTDAYISGGGQWSDGVNPMVFDTDGSITDARLGVGAKSSVLGFAGSAWTGTTFVEGYAIINGFLSGSGTTSDEDRYKATITHEVGHFLGLGHSQVTMHADFATMYPIIQKTAQKNVTPDDTAAIAWIYPATGHTGNVGAISGTVKTAANTNLSGVVVLAIDSVTGATYSSVVDYYSGNNTTSFTTQPTATGSYTIAGLPPGRYFVRIEPPKPEFSGGSSLASYSTPQNTGIEREWYNGAGESGDLLVDNENQKTGVVVTAGSTTSGINIVADESATTSTLSYHGTAARTWTLPLGTYTGYAVRFTAPSAGSLVGIKVRTEASSTMPLNGTLTVTVHANAAGSLAGIPGTAIGSVTIPYSDLSSNQDNDIWLRDIGTGVNFSAGTDFHVALTTNGVGVVSLVSDNGSTTQNRTSYYTTANGWRNMPSGMIAGTPGYNLEMSAIYSTTPIANPIPAISLSASSAAFGRSRPNVTVDRVITVTNSGSAPLNATAASITGADASAFSIVSGGAPFTVAAGASHPITLRFTPRRGGVAAKSASLSITTNAPTSPSTVSMSGTVVDPIATKLLASVALGAKRVDSAYGTNHTVIRNTGNDTLNISSIALVGGDANAGIRLLSSGAATRLAPDSTLAVRLEIAPAARRSYSTTLTVAHDDSTASSSFAITGSGVAPVLGSSADAIAYGDIRIQAHATSDLWLRNSGDAPMRLMGLSYTGVDSTAFTVVAPTSLPMTIAAGDSTMLRVRFAPTARRNYSATLRARTDANPATRDLALSGRGTAPVVLTPTVALVTATAVGASVEERPFAVRNLGDAPLQISAITVGGINASEFTITGMTLPSSVAPGDSLQVQVRFAPTAAGARSAEIMVATDDPQTAMSQVSLTASALQGRLALSNGTRLDFGDVTVATSADRSARIRNSGTAPLTITGIAPTGSVTFAPQLPSTPLTLQPGDSMLLPVRFMPVTPGAQNARIAFTSNGVESTVELELVGRGVAPGLALTRSAIAFGVVPTNQSRVDSFRVRNTGALPLDDVTLAISGAGASAFEVVSPVGTFDVAAGAEQTVVVRLKPQTGAAMHAAALRVTATGGAQSDVSLTATVVESMITAPAVVDYGRRIWSGPIDTTVVLTNSGTMPLRVDSVRVDGAAGGVDGQYFVASIATPTTIAPGASAEVRLLFTPDDAASSYTGRLRVFTNNPPDSVVTIALAGVIEMPAGVHDAVAGLGALSMSAISPNPASSAASFTLTTRGLEQVSVVILDLAGRMRATAFEGAVSGERTIHLELAALPAGDYTVVVRGARGVLAQRVVVVR